MAEKEGDFKGGGSTVWFVAQSKHPKSCKKKKKKKTIVRIVGYEEEGSGDIETNSSHETGDAKDHVGTGTGSDSNGGEA